MSSSSDSDSSFFSSFFSAVGVSVAAVTGVAVAATATNLLGSYK